jgi:hypothetical protein
MPDEEFKVEVELSDEDGLSFWERLKSRDLDDGVEERLGSRVTVTRDGTRMLLYTHTLADAQEAERTMRSLVDADELTAEYEVSRWNADTQQWVDPVDGDVVVDDAPDAPMPDPTFLILEAYKPEFLRDLGL